MLNYCIDLMSLNLLSALQHMAPSRMREEGSTVRKVPLVIQVHSLEHACIPGFIAKL